MPYPAEARNGVHQAKRFARATGNTGATRPGISEGRRFQQIGTYGLMSGVTMKRAFMLGATWGRLSESAAFAYEFPGLSKEYMPPLDEGSYLWMPSPPPHASINEALDVLQKQDMALSLIPSDPSNQFGRARHSHGPHG